MPKHAGSSPEGSRHYGSANQGSLSNYNCQLPGELPLDIFFGTGWDMMCEGVLMVGMLDCVGNSLWLADQLSPQISQAFQIKKEL